MFKTITRVKIGRKKHFFSIGPMELFQKIETYSSIKKATEAMGMSYTKALKIIRVVEEELGFPMVISEKGGNNHGATILTEKGKQVLTIFMEINAEVSEYAKELVDKKFKF
jgi:molybdate transport system regulatory protein